jgi:hypothetical protein
MTDNELEWFRPLWLRIIVAALVAAWFGWEVLVSRDTLWMLITGAALAYAVWSLFIAYKEPPPKGGATGTGTEKHGEPEA